MRRYMNETIVLYFIQLNLDNLLINVTKMLQQKYCFNEIFDFYGISALNAFHF